MLTVAVLTLVAAAGANAQAPQPPGYVGQHFDRFELLSNKHFTNAKQLTPGMVNNYVGALPGKAEPSAPIWTTRCSAGKQTATFRRTVELLGPPNDAYFNFTHEIGPRWAGKSPLRTYRVTLNGTLIAAGKVGKVQPGNIQTVLSAAQLQAFRDGANTLEVTVVKAKSPKTVRKCNTSTANRVGVTFVMRGNFKADLALVEPPPADVYRRAGTSNSQIVNLTLRNLGPSIIPYGTFTITTIGADSVVVTGSGPPQASGFPPLAPPFSGCAIDDSGKPSTYKVNCLLGRLRGGDPGQVTIAVRREFASTEFTEASTYLSWQIHSTVPDPVSPNNQRLVSIVWCGSQAKSQGCAGV